MSRRLRPSRRAVLGTAAAAGVAAAVGSCSVPASQRHREDGATVAPGQPVAAGRRAVLMQIVAHPDDDLYFMNPDTQHALDGGARIVSVYLTGGEANGDNRVVSDPSTMHFDKAAYSSARHQGLRQAYAALLGLPLFTPWQKDVLKLRGGHTAEVNSLVHNGRHVELVFLNTAMHTLRGGRMGLPSLWEDRALTLPVVIATGSPVTAATPYTYDELVEVVAGLLDTYAPTLVQTLDPDPDIQHSPEKTRQHDSEQPGYADHADHTAAASFAWAGMVRYVAQATQRQKGIPGFAVTSYRAYYNRHWPKNLPPDVLAEKAAHLIPYGGAPDWKCGNPGGCGDYNVGGKRPLTNWKGWVRSTHYRFPGPRPVVGNEPDGRLAAYGVLGLRAVRWRETAPGSGRFGAPDDLGGGPLAPVLGGAALKDGRQVLFGLRFSSVAGRAGANTREVVMLEQAAPGGKFAAWRGLGNPERGDDRGRRIGSPVAVTAPDGRLHLFVRNADKGVSSRVRESDGSWGPWADLGGQIIQDGLATALDAEGRVHLFAPGYDFVHHWAQDAPGQPLAYVKSGPRLPLAVDAPAAVGLPAQAGGGIQLLYRTLTDPRKTKGKGLAPADPRLLSLRADGTSTGPNSPQLDGYGTVGALHSPKDGLVVLGKDAKGRVRALVGTERRTRPPGVVPVDAPTLHLTARGPVAVGLGVDGKPWVWALGAAASTDVHAAG
ncbi:PIG-L family deacetylase [Streptomyces sp. NPDC048696]|uniref:PIG-L family deacetylase n=1 Tax=Streptomyces sp. NPDC048696 TaxID=3365585 RepID=UPI003714CAD1